MYFGNSWFAGGRRQVVNKATTGKVDPPHSHARRRAVIVFCAAFVALQVLVPLSLLPKPANKPFGWQMYSAVSGHRYEVKFADGSTKTADPGDYVLRYRSEVDYRQHLPQLICDRLPDATEVVASNALAGTTDRYPCER